MTTASPAPQEQTAPDAEPRRGRLPWWVTVLVALLVLVLVRGLLVQSFLIPTPSMAPTLQPGDRVLVHRSAFRFGGHVERGDVVVFDGAGVFEPASRPDGLVGALQGALRLVGVPVGESMYAKRVVGLPGERIACCDAEDRLTIDGRPLDEPWLAPGQRPSGVEFDVRVPPRRVFVLGDNRDDSADSRAHLGDPGGGTVPLDRMVGRVVAVYWPLDRIGTPDDEERG